MADPQKSAPPSSEPLRPGGPSESPDPDGSRQLPESAPRLRVLWAYARPHTGKLTLGLVLGLIGSGTGLATPMVTKWVIDSLDASGSLTAPVVTLIALMLLGLAALATQWILLGTLGERVVLEARESLLRRLFRTTVPGLATKPTGEMVTRVTSDTVLLREAATSSVLGIINGAVMLVGTLVLMGVLDPLLLGTTVVLVLLVAVLFMSLMPAIAKAQERAQEHIGRLGGALETSLRAIRTIKVSMAEDQQVERLRGEATASTEQAVRAVRKQAYAWSLAWAGVQVAIIVILGLGAWRVAEGQLAVSSLIAFLLYAFGLMEPIAQLSQNVTALQSGVAAAGRVQELQWLDVETDPPAGLGTPGPRDEGPVLTLTGVTASYGPQLPPAVREVSLHVPRKGHLAIVGPSGAGKTSLFSLVLRFLHPQRGQLLLDGAPYETLGHAQIRSRLAYVEQDTPLVAGTLGDNLRLARPDASPEEVERVLRQVRLTDRVAGLEQGLDTPLSATSLSGGERQRVAIARALLSEADILLLDEATAQLDGLTEAAIQDGIRAHAAEHAVVTIAHRLSTVVDADTIVLMEDGRIRAQGTHRELLATDTLYGELVRAMTVPQGPDPAAVAPAEVNSLA
ncbi:ABC transporter ATP-binding protein [Streptomyces sp. NPDC005438]|uniref:ABC transporter ATP-binding protein n=1 Tax=Streptomyces sp. NPDC005438 TaxID=3156880 RepID=UPI0033A80F88